MTNPQITTTLLAYFEAGRDQLEKGQETKQERKTYGKVIWMFPKIMVPTQIIHFDRVFHSKPSILGYPYFWKHPYRNQASELMLPKSGEDTTLGCMVLKTLVKNGINYKTTSTGEFTGFLNNRIRSISIYSNPVILIEIAKKLPKSWLVSQNVRLRQL